MTFKPRIWFPIAAVLSVLNVASVWIAAAPGEPLHATIHAALGVGFGLWAYKLFLRKRGRLLDSATEQLAAPVQEQIESFDAEMGLLRQELAETQERLDFAERMLTQARDRRQP